VLAKHAQIYPTEDELKAVQNAVQAVELALKEVSNKVHEQEIKVFTASNARLVLLRHFFLLRELLVQIFIAVDDLLVIRSFLLLTSL